MKFNWTGDVKIGGDLLVKGEAIDFSSFLKSEELTKYYSKEEIDAMLSEIGGVDLSEVEEKIQQNTDDITQLKTDFEKTDKSVSELAQRNIFTDEEKEKLSGLENYDDTLIKEQLEQKANADDVYSKSEVDQKIAQAGTDEVYTKSETDSLLEQKADANEVYVKDEVYSKTEADELLNGKANSSEVYSKNEADELLNKKADSEQVYSKNKIDTMFGDVESVLATVVEV